MEDETISAENPKTENASNGHGSDTMASESNSTTTRAATRAQASSRRRETVRDPINPVSPANSTESGKSPTVPANARDVFDYDIPLTESPGLQGYLELIQRRLSGDYPIDEFGCDPIYAQMWWPLFERLYRNYWRVDAVGVENVPHSGRAMVVANHSGGSYAWDAVMMSTAIHLEHPRPRYVHYVSTEFFYDTPFLSFDNRKKGAALACREDFVRLLERELVVGVFPEGVKGFLKPNDKRYQVQRFGRGGFVQLALATRTPIVPVSVVGGEELHFALGNSKLLARIVNSMIPQERADSFPILLNWLPLPIKWRIEFGEPIDVSKYGPEAARDTLLVNHLTEQVRAKIQEGLDRNLALRRSMFW
jgi:1-acyl-sn-glycerol-3-phosphate acyltransferase